MGGRGRPGRGRGASATPGGRQVVRRSERIAAASNGQSNQPELVGNCDNRMMTRLGLRSDRGASSSRESRRTTISSGDLAGLEGPSVQWDRTSVQAVLGQPELLELILDYAIHDKNKEKRVKSLKSVRLVNKNWLTGVTNVMRRSKESLFKLTLTKYNSLNGTSIVETQGKLLDEFVATVGKRIERPFPTFKLKILEKFFRCENYDSLLACLRQCGHGLVELEMMIPQNGGSFPGILPPVDLPNLQKFAATFTNKKVVKRRGRVGNEPKFADSANIISLIQILLNGAHALKTFSVPKYCRGPVASASRALHTFQFVTFPESITYLELKCQMSSENLELLTRNRLLNLLTLKLMLQNVSYTEGLLSKIMNNFGKHLQNLSLNRVMYGGPPRHVNLVRFPVMQQLTSFQLSYYGLELENDHSLLSDCFPKLERLSLYDQTPNMLRKWTVKSVTRMDLRLIDENKSGANFGNTLPLDLECMKSVHLSFSNVTHLTLKLSSGQEESGLKYLFMEMRKLTQLEIDVDRSESVINSDHWDSVFIGAPVPVIRETDYRESVELKAKKGVPRTALQTLCLKAIVLPEPTGGQAALAPLISDLTFTFALMKMINLRQLKFRGRFQASKEMTSKWKNMGRCITYSSK